VDPASKGRGTAKGRKGGGEGEDGEMKWKERGKGGKEED